MEGDERLTIDTPTRDLLDLVANDPHPSADHEWHVFVATLRAVALPDGTIPPAALRESVASACWMRRRTCDQ